MCSSLSLHLVTIMQHLGVHASGIQNFFLLVFWLLDLPFEYLVYSLNVKENIGKYRNISQLIILAKHVQWQFFLLT